MPIMLLPKSPGRPRIASWLKAPLFLMATSRRNSLVFWAPQHPEASLCH